MIIQQINIAEPLKVFLRVWNALRDSNFGAMRAQSAAMGFSPLCVLVKLLAAAHGLRCESKASEIGKFLPPPMRWQRRR